MGDSTYGLGVARPFNGDEHRAAIYPTYDAFGRVRRPGPGLYFALLTQENVLFPDIRRIVTRLRRGELDATRRASGLADSGTSPC
jgi:hypothetical protein